MRYGPRHRVRLVEFEEAFARSLQPEIYAELCWRDFAATIWPAIQEAFPDDAYPVSAGLVAEARDYGATGWMRLTVVVHSASFEEIPFDRDPPRYVCSGPPLRVSARGVDQ